MSYQTEHKFPLPVLHSPLIVCVCCSHSTKQDPFQLYLSPNRQTSCTEQILPSSKLLVSPSPLFLVFILARNPGTSKDSLGQKTKSFNNSTNVEASLGRKWEPLPLHSCYQQLNQWGSLYSLPKMSRGQERAALLRSCSSPILGI